MDLHISDRVASLSDALTLAINAKYRALLAAGEDAISFGTGEPDFDTPDHIREAGIQAIREGFTRYTPSSGIPALRAAVARDLTERKGVACEPNEVIITNGAKQALYQAFKALTEPGDRILIPSPYWVSYPEMARAVGAEPVFVDCRPEDGWTLRPEALADACDDRTRVLLLNTPNNPTGSVMTRADLEAVAAVCREKNLAVVADDIYERMVYEGEPHTCFAALDDDARSRTVTVAGVSKTYAMTGWRIGWLAAPAPVAGAIGNLQSHLTSNPASISQRAALAALEGDHAPVDAMVAVFARRRVLMTERLQALPGVELVAPRGAFYAFARVDAHYGAGLANSVEFCQALLEEEKIACVPGAAFGADGYIRLSYATSEENIARGLDRLGAFLARRAG